MWNNCYYSFEKFLQTKYCVVCLVLVIGVCFGLSACFLCAGPNPVESGKLYTDGQHYISNSARPSRAHPRQVFIVWHDTD